MTEQRDPAKTLTRALALCAAGALTLSLVAESAAQRGFGGRMMGGEGMRAPGNMGMRTRGNLGRYPGGDGPRFPGGMGPRGPGGILMLPGGYGPGPGRPGTVVVIDDDEPPRRRKARQKEAKQVKKKESRPQKQIAQRGGFDAPPPGETRFVPNEVLLNIAGDLSTRALDAIARRHRLTRIELRDFATTRRRIVRLRIDDGRAVAAVIRSLQSEPRVLAAQANHLYSLEQAKEAEGPPQYAVGKMRLTEAHALAKGSSVRVAVIDTTIDARHPDLGGTVAASFDATGTGDRPHPHGTGIAGVIAAHGRLTGAAPSVQILAVSAFSSQRASGSSMNILRGLDWAGTSNANIVNMSFAGPADSEVRTMLAALRRRGMVLIAAAGNAGPNSRPLYPAAEPDVIAVTATDADDRVFAQANRGTHIAVAAPGVAILAAAPNDSYQMQTGTSFAAAQVSGVAALLIERNRTLDPAAIRRILTSTARDLGPAGHDDQFGSGLVDALGAVEQAAPNASDVSGTAARPTN